MQQIPNMFIVLWYVRECHVFLGDHIEQDHDFAWLRQMVLRFAREPIFATWQWRWVVWGYQRSGIHGDRFGFSWAEPTNNWHPAAKIYGKAQQVHIHVLENERCLQSSSWYFFATTLQIRTRPANIQSSNPRLHHDMETNEIIRYSNSFRSRIHSLQSMPSWDSFPSVSPNPQVTTFAPCYDEKNPRYQFQQHPESCFILFQPEEMLGHKAEELLKCSRAVAHFGHRIRSFPTEWDAADVPIPVDTWQWLQKIESVPSTCDVWLPRIITPHIWMAGFDNVVPHWCTSTICDVYTINK